MCRNDLSCCRHIMTFLCNVSKTGINLFCRQIASRHFVLDILKLVGTFIDLSQVNILHGTQTNNKLYFEKGSLDTFAYVRWNPHCYYKSFELKVHNLNLKETKKVMMTCNFISSFDRIQQQQLVRIYSLLSENQDSFGNVSFDDVQRQMHMYTPPPS